MNAVFKEPTSKGKEGEGEERREREEKGEGRERKGEGRGRGWEGRGGENDLIHSLSKIPGYATASMNERTNK